MVHQLAHARNASRLTTQDLPDFDPETQCGTLLPESTNISLLAQHVRGLVTVSHEPSGVTQKLATISQENDAIREALDDFSSQLAYLPPPQDDSSPQALADLQASIRDLSHCVLAPIPAPPQARAATPTAHPSFIAPSARPYPCSPPRFYRPRVRPLKEGEGKGLSTSHTNTRWG